ncbi:CCA tRNA nucleotidyltransferase [Gottfriedia endophytica]|nr:CCA tRNA nucleotidyltransferase [Gottfriedia endophytica]
MDKFNKAKPVLQKLIDNGYDVYFVGGCVRDHLLRREIGDVDIATSAKPEEVMTLFQRTVPTGLQHGTVLVLHDNESYEVTTFRTEDTYLDFRRPNAVNFVTSINEDLKRRDFSMNAIAMTIDHELIDPFKGEVAINEKLIVTVGKSIDRFKEDALRMMRAIRFVSQLQFQLDQETKESISENGYLIEKVAVERILVEFEKMLLGNGRKEAVNILIETHLEKSLPNLALHNDSLKKFAQLPLNYLETIEELWTVLIYKMNLEETGPFLRSWKMSNDRRKSILLLMDELNNNPSEWTNYDLYRIGLDKCIKLLRINMVINHSFNSDKLMELTKRYMSLPIKSSSDLCINGNDLLSWSNKKGGPWLKETIILVEKNILENQLENEMTAIREWFEQWDRQ